MKVVVDLNRCGDIGQGRSQGYAQRAFLAPAVFETFSDQAVIAQGTLASRRFVAVYGDRGRVTAAASVNRAKYLEYYEHLIETAAPFPPAPSTVDPPADRTPFPSDVPDPILLSHGPTVALTATCRTADSC